MADRELRPAEHHLSVERSARYYQLGEITSETREVWVVAHGYGQLASRFITVFNTVATASRVIIAPEGLSRFYVDRGSEPAAAAKVGASWMTREHRLQEITDYIAYLDAVYERVTATVDRSRLRLTALGFSQGVATVARWIVRGRARAARLIACGGLLPPELEASDFAKLRDADLIFVMGRRDESMSEALLAHEESRLRAHGVPTRAIWFDGGHEVGKGVIEELGRS